MPTAQINGVELYYQLSGQKGNPLVLVHGSWGDHHNWDPVVPTLASSFRVLTYDRRGHSQSERPAGQGSKREDAADLAVLIEHLDFAPAHIVGSSFGASIVLRLASERPELFRSLIVHEPPLFGLLKEPSVRDALQTSGERIQVVVELLEAGQMESGVRQFVESIMIGPGAWEKLPEEVRQLFIFNAPTWLDEMRDPEWKELDVELLAGFAPPALLTQGGQSEAFLPLVMEEVARALPGALRRTFPEAGHVPYSSHPEEYVEAVTAFINAAS
jgi:pimeloyl-ACP methyl ester carboxylesterase